MAQKTETVAPDYKKIKKEVNDLQSQYYYPKIFGKYERGDTTMTLEEKRHLYYGYKYRHKSSGRGNEHFEDSLGKVFEKGSLSQDDYADVIRFSDSVLADNPLNMRTLNVKINGLKSLGRIEEKERTIVQIRMIMDAIFSSGDGKSEKTAFYVINVPDEYNIISILGYTFGGSQLFIKGRYDLLTLAKNKDGLKKLYFETSQEMDMLSDLFK